MARPSGVLRTPNPNGSPSKHPAPMSPAITGGRPVPCPEPGPVQLTIQSNSRTSGAGAPRRRTVSATPSSAPRAAITRAAAVLKMPASSAPLTSRATVGAIRWRAASQNALA